VDEILTSVKDTTDKISRGEGTVGKLITEEGIYNDIRQISERIVRGEGTIGKLINDAELYNDMKNFLPILKNH